MSVFAGGSISVCVYVKHACTFPEGDNTVFFSLQQLAREWTLENVAVIHTEKTAGAERFQDLANCKQINKHYRKEKKKVKRAQKCRNTNCDPDIVAHVKNIYTGLRGHR